MNDDFRDDDDDLLEALVEEDREALRVLTALLPDAVTADPPPEIDRALASLQAGTTQGRPEYAYFAAACGWSAGLAVGADPGWWLDALASTVSPLEDPGTDDEEQSLVAALDHGDWLAVVVGLVHDGPGADARPAALVDRIRSSEVIETEVDPDDETIVEGAFEVVLPLWRTLGVVDDDGRLTRLGAWGLPLALDTAWHVDEDDDLAELEVLAAGASGALLHWQQAPQEWDSELYAEAARLLGALVFTPLVADLGGDERWQPFLARIHEAIAGTAASAAPAYLLALRAEWVGDTAGWSRWIAAAMAADPSHAPSLEAAASEAADRGDAATARDLLRRAEVDATDPELATYIAFARPPTGGPSRNAPCPCGSGRKFKMCCGTRAQHPLPARASWLWEKVTRFAQRPPQREVMVDWGMRFVGDDEEPSRHAYAAAMTDPLTLDAALWDGGLLERFLAVRGPLLPADELALARKWQGSRRSAYEVASTRPGVSVALRDLATDDVIEVRERTASRQLKRGNLLLARLLATGDGSMLGSVMSVPRMQRRLLLEALASGEADDVFSWMAEGRRPPKLTNREGDDLLAIEQRWRVSDEGWSSLAAELEDGGEGVLHEMFDDGSGERWIRGRLERQGGDAVLSVNSQERLTRLVARLREADPQAEFLSDESAEPGALRSVPDPVEMTPDLVAAIEGMMREHEERWVDEEIPMFGNRTPREMVQTAAGRREVEDFLHDVEAQPMPPGLPAAGMDAGRIRALLGLPTPLR